MILIPKASDKKGFAKTHDFKIIMVFIEEADDPSLSMAICQRVPADEDYKYNEDAVLAAAREWVRRHPHNKPLEDSYGSSSMHWILDANLTAKKLLRK